MPQRGNKRLWHVLLKLSAHDVGEYFKLAMGVSSETGARIYTILINDAKRAELFVSAALIPWLKGLT